MKALELAKAIDGQFVGSNKVVAELRRLAEVNAELLAALEAVCKEFDVLKFPLNNHDMSQAALVSYRASYAIAKAKDQK